MCDHIEDQVSADDLGNAAMRVVSSFLNLSTEEVLKHPTTCGSLAVIRTCLPRATWVYPARSVRQSCPVQPPYSGFTL